MRRLYPFPGSNDLPASPLNISCRINRRYRVPEKNTSSRSASVDDSRLIVAGPAKRAQVILCLIAVVLPNCTFRALEADECARSLSAAADSEQKPGSSLCKRDNSNEMQRTGIRSCALCAQVRCITGLGIKRAPPVLIVNGKPFVAGVAVDAQLVEVLAASGGPSQFKLDDTTGCYYSRVDQRGKHRGDHRVAEAG